MVTSSAADRAVVAANLACFRRLGITRPGLRAASVAVCVLLRQDVPLPADHQAGIRPAESRPAVGAARRKPRAPRVGRGAALRELREETGVAAGPGEVLGTLDAYATRSGFLITPVMVWGGPAGTLVRQSSEVARIHLIPLAGFDGPPELLRIPGSPAPVRRLALTPAPPAVAALAETRRGAKWGAIIGRHQATPRLLKRSIYAI
jgi:8-oxo-dGTP pyrophosphatase MutT (NUDIX family)